MQAATHEQQSSAESSPNQTQTSSLSSQAVVDRDTVKILTDSTTKAWKNEARHEARDAAGVLIPAKSVDALKAGFLRMAQQAKENPPPADEGGALFESEVAKKRELAAVPDRYRDATSSPDSTLPGDVREKYAGKFSALMALENHSAMVALLGRRGVGKTWMACALVNQFVLSNRSAHYCRAMDILLALKETYRAESRKTQRDVQRMYEGFELLVIDEMAVRSDTPWEDIVLTDLIDRRYAVGRSTVMISNEEPKAFVARVGPSIADRIRDGGGLIECDWSSLRGRDQ